MKQGGLKMLQKRCRLGRKGGVDEPQETMILLMLECRHIISHMLFSFPELHLFNLLKVDNLHLPTF